MGANFPPHYSGDKIMEDTPKSDWPVSQEYDKSIHIHYIVNHHMEKGRARGGDREGEEREGEMRESGEEGMGGGEGEGRR